MTHSKTRLGILAAAMAVCLSAAAGDEVVRRISLQTGSLESTTGWSQRWTGNETSPSISMTASRKDMAAATDGINLDMREGTAHASTYTIIPEAGWRVKEISISFRSNDNNNPVTISAMGRKIVSADTVQTLTVQPRDFDSPALTLTGNNQGISTTDFRVTLVEVEPEPYTEAVINMSTGKFTSSVGVYNSLWQSGPLCLTSTNGSNQRAANMAVASDGVSLALREGSAGTSNYYLVATGSSRVSGFELTFVSNDPANPVTVTCGSQSLTSSTEPQTISVKGIAYGQLASFTLSGSNKGITATSFKAHLADATPTGHGISVFTYTGVEPFQTVYRIPVVVYIPAGPKAGRLVAVNDFRPCGADIGFGEVDLHISHSDDGGLTWSAPADPVDAQGNHVADGDGQGTPATSNENRDCGFGDPVLVADCESGDLLMLGTCGRVPIGQATRAIPQGIAIWHSKDGGETWTQWKDITESILTQLDNNCDYGKVDGFFFTAGRMVQSKYVKVGSHYRVYVVAGGASRTVNDTQCWVFYTDDFGDSWHILGDPMKPALTTGGAEPKCEELPDGSVLFSGRAGGGVRNWNIFSYTDIEKGQGYWDNAVGGAMVTGGAHCNGDALIIPVKNTQTGAGAYLLLQSTPCHPSSRINVGINYKVLANGFEDFGTAKIIASDWDGYIQATSLPSAYSSLTVMPDGTVGFIYEEATYGRDYCEVYRNFSVEDITAGQFTYAPDENCATALELTRQMVSGRLNKAKTDYSSRTQLLETR
ncbi:MAG: glycoside hydrolase, partial [Muribaculaceae bacterium]|nr:glycoside hydrolase [Muribaculaceae bacterium]